MRYTWTRLLDPDGCELWSGVHSERLAAAHAAIETAGEAGPAETTLLALAGAETFPGGTPRPRDSEVTAASERLGLVSRRGVPRGFFVLPPAGAYLERCVEAFNAAHLDRLGAVEIQLPAVYSAAEHDVSDLTAGYETEGRTFRLDAGRDELRLSYAADPGLFSWLRGRRLRAASLPFAAVSPMQIFRHYRSGELGPLKRTRQFALPDLHLLVTPEDAERACLEMVAANADGMRFWVGNGYVQFVDQTEEFGAEHPELAARMARRAACYTLVNQFAEQPRYYRMRSGLMADAGTDALMLYNIQWDEENPRRFAVTLDSGERPTILHGNGLAGSGILCLVVGRALAGLAPRRLPPELAATTVHVLPVDKDSADFADAYATRLAARGLRARARPSPTAGLGAALRVLREGWAAAIVVVGERERTSGAPRFEVADGLSMTEAEFFAHHLPRVRRCTPLRAGSDMPLPFD